MNIKAVGFWLGICSAVALASESNPPLLWELADSTLPSSDSLTSNTQSNANATADERVTAGQFNVTPNIAALQQLSINQELMLQLPRQDIQVRLIDVRHMGQQKVWTYENLTTPSSPKGKLFVKQNSFSAWIPSLRGAWRLQDGVVTQELKWGGEHRDIRIKTSSAAQPKIAPLFGEEATEQFPDSMLLMSPHPSIKQSSQENDTEDTSNSGSESAPQNLYGDEEFIAQVKVLFAFTEEFAQNVDDAEETIQQWVEVNNEIYQASGVNIKIEIADTVEAALEDYSNDQILDNLSRSDADNSTYGDIDEEILQEVWEARLETGADLVTVFTHERPNGICGTSWINGTEAQVFDYLEGVNVVSLYTRFGSGNQQACSMDTLGHEVGHNMGLAHSHEQGEEGQVFHYGRGYGVEDEFSTVMAYPQAFGEAVAVPFYSSPELECGDGLACGVASHLHNGADAVKALNLVATRVAQIHNEAVTLPFEEALSELDEQLAECVEDANQKAVTNEEVAVMNCPGSDVDSLSGVEFFPRLRFFSVNRTENISLAPFRHLQEVTTLDFRLTRIEDLRPIAHLKNQLEYLRFFSENMSCQDEMVAASWGIEEFHSLRGCEARDDDEEDFDDDGINNLNDTDDDNDGIDDLSDALPFDDRNAGDIDADGVPDEKDAFPYDPEEHQDSDRDTIGDNRDDDDDNDGFSDDEDCAPLDPERAEVCEIVYVPFDFDGDSKADVAVRRASIATQFILNSSNSELQREELGRQLTDIVVSGDFDGDKIADLGVRRPEDKMWFIRPSSEGKNALWRIEFGLQEEDIPVPADYDGDGITDVAVRRPSTFQWFVLRSSDGEIDRYELGRHVDDIPVPADYDGDGLADIAVRRPSNQLWYILNSSDNEISRVSFGLQEEDIPVPADYDGDGITDVAVRRPSTQSWFILRSSDGEIMRARFGLQEEDIPIVADYDGDGRADIAVRRPSIQTQFILRSSDLEIERIRFGLESDDMPLAAPVSVRFSTIASVSDTPAHQGKPGSGSEFEGIDVLSQEEAAEMGVIKP